MVVRRSLLVGIFAVWACSAQNINISGTVTDTGGTPLPGAIVTLVNAGLTATARDNGSFALAYTGVRRQNNPLPTHGHSAGIFNGVLYVNLQEELDVEVTALTLRGKVIVTLKRTMGAGTNSLTLPKIGAGVCIYKVTFGKTEFMTKIASIDGMSHGASLSVQASSLVGLAKQAKSTGAFNDALLATKDGYLNYRMSIANSDTSGIEIQMTPGTGLALAGLQRMIVLKDVPAGTFTMGSSDTVNDSGASPPHQVTLSAFAMQETDVTQDQYLAVMGSNPSHFDSGTGALLRPVDKVSWHDAAKYCNALSRLSRLSPVYDTSAWTADFSKTGYRLPTEAQWEYACRAGSTTEYWWGPDTNGMGARAWSADNSDSTTHPVATKLANAYGLYDMTGNVWQWCNGWYGSYTAGAATDPAGDSTGTSRILRGGSWVDDGGGLRSAYRYGIAPDTWVNDVGFRVVLPGW